MMFDFCHYTTTTSAVTTHNIYMIKPHDHQSITYSELQNCNHIKNFCTSLLITQEIK